MIRALQKRLSELIEEHGRDTVLRDSMLGVLARPGFPLHPQAPCRAGVLTLNVYQSIRGSLNPVAFQAAAAVELHMVAAYLFDHVADHQVEAAQGLSEAEELALAIAFMSCGAAAACQAVLEAGLGDSGLKMLLRLHQNCLQSCGGQFLDARMEKQGLTATTEEALKMTSLKGGALGRLAAEFGAGIATDDPLTVSLCGEMGFNLFTYLQLIDDLRDACPEQSLSLDLLNHKKTVPLAFFCNSFYNSILSEPFEVKGESWGDAGADLKGKFAASGAPAFSALVAEAFLNRAKGNLQQLSDLVGSVENLERFISPLEIRPQELVSSHQVSSLT
ncbi:MAG: polyprenyl synthetase family protein [Chloroflexota bacterium]